MNYYWCAARTSSPPDILEDWMTRDEAIAKLREVATRHSGAITAKSIEMYVDGYAALGLLQLDEPKEPIEELFASLRWGGHSREAFNEALADTGLKIVRA
jgi:hypothetical protein